MKLKKLVSIAVAAVMSASIMVAPIQAGENIASADISKAASGGEFNYAEALQKSLYFYECQQAGPLPDWNRVEWRADSTMNDEVTGGWYDAGDGVKFNLPMSYSASMLAWGLYEYGDGIEACGQREILEKNLAFTLDYIQACDRGNEVVYQIGDGGADHKWWGSIELIELEMERPYFTASKASCVIGEMSAALASGYTVLKDVEPEKAAGYLEHAKSLFKLADSERSDDEYKKANGYYDSWSGFWDELFWAANWLYIATGDKTYLDKAESYIPNLPHEDQSTELKYSWAHCWDNVTNGAMILYARSTGDKTAATEVQKNLDFWSVGYNGRKIKTLDGGLGWLDQWGSLRYATTEAFIASVWADYIDDESLKDRYNTFAETQINYALGDNPDDHSYVVGFGKNPPCRPHHRTSHGPWLDDNAVTPVGYNRHILYGALVGGPGGDGSYADDIHDHQKNEVATDYNAGYTAMLCKMVSKYGGETLSNFPEKEEKDGPEFYMEACINQSNATYTELKVLATNHSAWPARYISDLSYNYYFDISEVLDAGYTVNDIKVSKGYDEWSNTEVSQPIQYSGNIYYVKVSYPDGSVLAPIGQEQHQAEVQFRIAVKDGTNFWNPENDYSFQGLKSGNENVGITDKITMYDGDKLIYGVEPDGKVPEETDTPKETTTTEETTVTETESTPAETTATTPIGGTTSDTVFDTSSDIPSDIEYGDVNSDTKVNILDVAEFCKVIGAGGTFTDPQIKANADCVQDGTLDMKDALALLQFITKAIPSLPISA